MRETHSKCVVAMSRPAGNNDAREGIGIDIVEREKEKLGRALMHVPVRAGRDLALD
jgi:hypothetical protein